ncbi:HAD hydrolase-like protein [Desulfovibrio sp. OttesenSCG-928-G15]|nr:HAD hydrolase-like protein [Desulfovibrio sp. OttesenSCG-928-G15]
MSYSMVLFDLDGTLLQSGEGIINGMRHALDKLGVTLPANFDGRVFIGPPLRYSLSVLLHLPDEQAEEGVRLYREYYNVKGYVEAAPYPGIMDLLAELQKRNTCVCLATSKYCTLAERMADHFGFRPFLQGIYASDGTEKSSAKKAIIESALTAFPDSASAPVMVGDTRYDAEGAREAGVPFIGVTFGYGTREELRAEGCQTFADTPMQLRNLLLQ